jgi:Zn-dependent peptidase ImmA (M78 family)
MTTDNRGNGQSVLASLRALVPDRHLTFLEALRIAELQATRLLRLTHSDEAPVPCEVVTELPRISVERRDLPTSGLSYWNGESWVIALNQSEPTTRQRLTLLHEYKHILDHGRTDALYHGEGHRTAAQQAEQAADYFAGCALIPRTALKRAWAHGVQRSRDLAQYFEVSRRAIEVRLAQVGLSDESDRCSPPLSRRQESPTTPSHRQLSLTWLTSTEPECA